jgi:hypothetical protein
MNGEHQHAGHLPQQLKELAKDLEPQFTHLEQHPPNKPSFLLVVLLSGVAIIFIFIMAWIVLRWEGGGMVKHIYRKSPTSQLILPSTPTPTFPTVVHLA